MKRQGNKLSHLLTQHVKEIDNIDSYVTWIKENTSLIELTITHDVMSLSSF